jgi:hypothetical protein
MNAMAADRLEVCIDAGPDVDDEELARLSRWLRDELLQLNVEKVDYVTGLAPMGAKSGAVLSFGTMIVTLSDSAVLAALVGVLRAWVRRGSNRRVTIQSGEDKLDIRGTMSEREHELITRWLDQHAGK